MSSHLIDSTEMYARTVLELEEEGIPPIRARIAERLGLTAPSVSESVARLETEGLLRLTEDRHVELTDEGRALALSVMRKHRLAERLLTDVIGLSWEQVHEEACRWEHVISDAVEEKLVELLGEPHLSPYGNPIPGLADRDDEVVFRPLAEAAKSGGEATIVRISEQLQMDVEALDYLHRSGLMPGATVSLAIDDGDVVAQIDGERVAIPEASADLIYVAQ